MESKKYRRFWLISLLGMIAASAYPIYMGISALIQTIRFGGVQIEKYPKYIIPYTPIAIAVIAGIVLIRVFLKETQKNGFLVLSIHSVAAFFIFEQLLEKKVQVIGTEAVNLESWQMSLCFVPPQQYRTRTWEAVDVLLGGYSPAFKIHFYLISIVIILSLLNCFYGFAKMIRTEDYSRKKALIIQAVTAVVFLGMCIWACFTAFYRSGELTVSALSAVLMAVFFAVLGITVGVFTGSFTLGRKAFLSTVLPTVIAMAVTVFMYIGETILLNGNLYRFGSGFLFERLGKLVLAPVDILIVLMSGIVSLVICKILNKKAVLS